MNNHYDLIVIGSGPAGISSAISAKENGSNCLLIEREASLGGILKQCIHDGFGLITFNEKLSGPEYIERYIEKFKKLNIDYLTLAFVIDIKKTPENFILEVVTRDGIKEFYSDSLILACGCRERTAKGVFIHGTRPYGVLTAGSAQALVNLNGVVVGKNVCILGSGDIGLIMARRMVLEGANVIGVYEIKDTPSGLSRNIHQCLNDYNIPLHLSTTVKRVFGYERLEAIEIVKVDKNFKPIDGTEEIIECDTLLLSVGLIPENELGEKIGIEIDSRTKGAKCDNNFETVIDNVYTCGNSTHVNDLVDYVSLSGKIAGKMTTIKKDSPRLLKDIIIKGNTMYLVPQMLNINSDLSNVEMFFRSNCDLKEPIITISVDGNIIFKKKYMVLRPPEMEKISVNLSQVNKDSTIEFNIEGIKL